MAAAVEDVVVAFEDAVGEPVVAHELPDVLDRIEFGRSRRERHEGDIAGSFEGGRCMPSGLVEHDEGMGSGLDGEGVLGEVGGVFAPVRRERDADGLEDLAELALDVGAGGGALAVLPDGGLLQAVEVADQVVPFDGGVGGVAAVGQFLLEDEGEKGAEDVAADWSAVGAGTLPRLLHPADYPEAD